MLVETRPLNIPYEECGIHKTSTSCRLTSYILDYSKEMPSSQERPAVLICPGGGYHMLSDREAEPIAIQLTAMGFHAFILWYSVDEDHFPTQLIEAATAIAYIRSQSMAYRIISDKIAIMGFSAGGHVAASLGVFWNRRFVYQPLSMTADQIRPNGLILCYPVITGWEHAHRESIQNLLGNQNENLLPIISLEEHVGTQVPKTFLWHTYTDPTVPVENSFLFALALKKSGINLEMHIYPTGGHGLSLASEETKNASCFGIEPACQSWITLLERWMQTL